MKPEERREVMDLVLKRERARLDKNWADADAIRDQLKRQGVQMNDREDLWQCGPMVGLYDPSYNVKDTAIRTILQVREDARQAKDYAISDTIRGMLAEAGIEIKDREGYWYSTRDDRQGSITETINGGPMTAPPGAGPPGGRPTPSERQMPSQSYAPIRAMRNAPEPEPYGRYGAPPPPSDQGARYGRGSSVSPYGGGGGRLGPPADGPPPPPPGGPYGGGKGHGYGSYGGGQPPPPPSKGAYGGGGMGDYGGGMGDHCRDVVLTLEDFLIRREEARNAADWAEADKIRDVLNMMGIHLKDKERRWNLNDGRSGEYPPRF